MKCWTQVTFFFWVEGYKTASLYVIPPVPASLTSSPFRVLWLSLVLFPGLAVILCSEGQGSPGTLPYPVLIFQRSNGKVFLYITSITGGML